MLHFVELIGTGNPVFVGHCVFQFIKGEAKTHTDERLTQVHQMN